MATSSPTRRFVYRESRRLFVQHPCRQKCERAVRLQDNYHFHFIRDEPSSDDNGLTELRLERIVELDFCRIFARSMPRDEHKSWMARRFPVRW
jgi:hypothetical protein